jgi:hypothetical protein
MAITDKAKRQVHQERGAREGWSGRRTADFIQVQVFMRKRSTGGRPFAPPRTLTELIQQMERHQGQWLRRYAFWIAFVKEGEQKGTVLRSSQRFQGRVKEAREALKMLASRANELAKRLESFEKDDL